MYILSVYASIQLGQNGTQGTEYKSIFPSLSSEGEQQLLLEVMERRVERTTTIICPQYDPEGWIERLGESAVSIHSGGHSRAD